MKKQSASLRKKREQAKREAETRHQDMIAMFNLMVGRGQLFRVQTKATQSWRDEHAGGH